MLEGACLQLPDYFWPFVYRAQTEDKPLPRVPGEIVLEEASPGRYVVPLDTPLPSDGRSNVPIVRLGSHDPDDDFFYDEPSDIEIVYRPRLSKISELPEPSEISTTSMRSLSREAQSSLGSLSSQTSTTDFGHVIGESIAILSFACSSCYRTTGTARS